MGATACRPGSRRGPWPPISAGMAPLRVRGSQLQHLGGNLLLRLCRAGYGISMETLPLRLCGLGRCHLHGNAAAAAVQAGMRWPGTGCPQQEGWGCPGHPWLRGDGGEPDPPPRLKGVRGSRGRSTGHPCPRHGGRRDREIGGSAPVPTTPTQNLPPLPHSLRTVPSRASRLRRVLVGARPLSHPGAQSGPC